MMKHKFLFLAWVVLMGFIWPALGMTAEGDGAPMGGALAAEEDEEPAPAAPAGESEEAAPAKEESKAAAEDEADTGKKRTMELPLAKKAKVVQKKLIPRDMRHELGLMYAYDPSDSFVHRQMLSFHYDFHFVEHLGFKVGFGYLIESDKSDTKVLTASSVQKNGLDISRDQLIIEQNGLLTGSLVFTPFYGKFSLMSAVIAHFDAGIGVGGGVLFWDGWSEISPTLHHELYSNIYILNWLSVRASWMAYYSIIGSDPRQSPSEPGTTRGGTLLRMSHYLGLGVSFHLPPM